MSLFVYFGQADGPRVLRYGEGHKLVQSDGTSVTYLPYLEFWDLQAAGPVGDVVYRSIDVKLRHTLGYIVKITPIVDGVAEPTQHFSGGPPAGGKIEEYVELQAKLAKRGTQISATIELDSAFGDQSIATVEASGVPLRRVP